MNFQRIHATTVFYTLILRYVQNKSLSLSDTTTKRKGNK